MARRWIAGILAFGACGVAVPAIDAPPILVHDAVELLEALQPANAGRRIRVARGEYTVTRPLRVPDYATLEGDSVVRLDAGGLPGGFEPGTETTLRVTAGFDGDVLTLGNGSALRGLRVIDLESPAASPSQRRGNVVSVRSRVSGDRIAASIADCELVNPNAAGFSDWGPLGHGIVVLTDNPGLGAPPAAHAGAQVALYVRRSIVRTRSGGVLFAVNFAARGMIDVRFEDNLLDGSLGVAAGVSRPDRVTDAVIRIDSRHNRYRRTTGATGWSLMGGSTSPHFTERSSSGAARNRLQFTSADDHLDGFVTGIRAVAARRLGSKSSLLTDNRVDLDLRGTRIDTAGTDAADLVLWATLSEVAQGQGLGAFPAGDRNVLSVRFDDVRGSGERRNEYAEVVGPVRLEASGRGNRLRLHGSPDRVIPAPAPRFFAADRP